MANVKIQFKPTQEVLDAEVYSRSLDILNRRLKPLEDYGKYSQLFFELRPTYSNRIMEIEKE